MILILSTGLFFSISCCSVSVGNIGLHFQTLCIQQLAHSFSGSFAVGLGDMAQKIITIIIFISVDIDNYHDKCQIFISFKFKAIFLLQSESFRNQTINFP